MRIVRSVIFALALNGLYCGTAQAQYIATPDSVSRVTARAMGLSDSLARADSDPTLNSLPRVDYTIPARPYIVGKITANGLIAIDQQMLINNFSISSGDTILIPGETLGIATRSLLDRRYFSNLKIGTTFRADTVDLDLYIRERVQVREWQFNGIRETDHKELEEKLQLRRNHELSDYTLQTSIALIRKYYDEKAYRNAQVTYRVLPDTLIKTAVIVHFDIERGEKVRIGEIKFAGNQALSSKQLAGSLKQTKKVNVKFWESFKYKEKEFKEDLNNVTGLARSKGYRDSRIVSDSTYSIPGKPKRMGIYIEIEEGHKYHYRNFSWLGNTLYPTEGLNQQMGFKPGDVYDSETMDSRLQGASPNEPSIANTYKNQGYLAFMIDPIETVIPGDSIDVEFRVIEGSQFRIRNVGFEGNSRTNDHVIRRQLDTKPGDLYNQALLMRTYQLLASMGQFDPKSLNPDVQPNMQQELVDINFQLTEVGNDQLELSGGWGGGMFIASVGVNFTNVSLRSFFDKKAWRPYPGGDNQTIGLKLQTNGTYYRALSVNFIEPWLGGRRPTSFSASFYTSRETNAYQLGEQATAYFGTIGGNVGFGKRLNWPDPYFTFSAGVTIQSYNLYNWPYFIVQNGRSNTLAFNLGIARSSVDDPMQYATRGSAFSLNLAITPPWSAFDGKDYSKSLSEQDRYRWIEYHKWRLNAQWYFPLSLNNKLVLMARAQFGYLGYFDRNKPSPFEGFQMGGDGLSGYSMYGVETIGLRGYPTNSLTPLADVGVYANIFSKYTFELRYPLLHSAGTLVYGLVFAEAGNAYNLLSEFKPFSLKRAAGVGMRVYLPFLGMLGIDWGYGFDPVSSSNGKPAGGKFSFSMGTPL